jgi:hypothetical protein
MADPKEATLSTSDFNLQKLNTKEFGAHVAATIQMGGNLAVFGRRGSGKTIITKYEIEQSGFRELYLNLSVLERTDLAGYPNILGKTNRKYVDFLLPSFYEMLMEGNKPVVVVYDEIDKADPSLWAPLLEMVQFGSINGTKFPNLRANIMTGNLISEGGSRPSLPLLDRAEKFLLEADATLWLDWAGKRGHIHPSITAYINDHPNDLFGTVDPEDRYADASPRGWERASNIIKAGEEKGWSSNMLNSKVSGCIGKAVGLKYAFYFQYYIELMPLIDKIFAGENVKDEYNALEPTKKIVACMITCARFANMLDQTKVDDDGKRTLPKCYKHIGTFLSKAGNENVLVSVRSQIQLDRIIRHSLDEQMFWREMMELINKEVEA